MFSRRNEFGVKEQSDCYRIRNGIKYQGYDCCEDDGNEESKVKTQSRIEA